MAEDLRLNGEGRTQNIRRRDEYYRDEKINRRELENNSDSSHACNNLKKVESKNQFQAQVDSSTPHKYHHHSHYDYHQGHHCNQRIVNSRSKSNLRSRARNFIARKPSTEWRKGDEKVFRENSNLENLKRIYSSSPGKIKLINLITFQKL